PRPKSGLPSDCHPDCIIVLEAVRMRPGEIKPRTRRWKKCVTLLDSKSPIQGLGRHRPVPLGHKDVRGRPLFALQAPQRAYLGGKGPAAVAGGAAYRRGFAREPAPDQERPCPR